MSQGPGVIFKDQHKSRMCVVQAKERFHKLFNCLAAQVAHRISVVVGLDPEVIDDIVAPFLHSRDIWRMQANIVVPPVVSSGGLPQGKAGSVLLSEICLSELLWKLDKSVGVALLSYVDDVNFFHKERLAGTVSELAQMIAIA